MNHIVPTTTNKQKVLNLLDSFLQQEMQNDISNLDLKKENHDLNELQEKLQKLEITFSTLNELDSEDSENITYELLNFIKKEISNYKDMIANCQTNIENYHKYQDRITEIHMVKNVINNSPILEILPGIGN
jgi:hypothetical protein